MSYSRFKNIKSKKEISKVKAIKEKHELFSLMNVGKATYGDLQVLGIETILQLAKEDPDELYTRLQQITGVKHDPCVLVI